jgi:hypothetical protein
VQRTPTYERQKKINAWMVAYTTGLIEGAPSHLAVERAHVVGDRTNLLVLPIVRLGTTERLYVRGTDLAIINSGACACLPMNGGFETHSPSKV